MDFVIPYEAVDYGAATPKESEQRWWKPYKVDTKDLDAFVALRKPRHAADFFMSHGALLDAPPRYSHAAPGLDAQTLDGKPYIEHQTALFLEAAKVLRFSLNLRMFLDDLPKDYRKLIEALGVEIVDGYRLGFDDEQSADSYTLALWSPRIACREYSNWLVKDSLKTMPWDDYQVALDSKGNPIMSEVKYEGLAVEGRNSVSDACTELLDKLVANHLQDIKVVTSNGTPCLYPSSLISALWYLAAETRSKSEIRKCSVCGNPMIVHVDTKSAANTKKFCSNGCKQKNYRAEKKRRDRHAVHAQQKTSAKG